MSPKCRLVTRHAPGVRWQSVVLRDVSEVDAGPVVLAWFGAKQVGSELVVDEAFACEVDHVPNCVHWIVFREPIEGQCHATLL